MGPSTESTGASSAAPGVSGESLAATAAFAEAFVPEDAVQAATRARAVEIGLEPVSPATGAALRLLAATARARTAVEVGTDAGVSGLYLLRGMQPDGVLTSIDPEAEAQRLARAAFTADGVPNARARLINGRALDVMPRLTDGAYDIVFCASDRREYPDLLPQAIRLVRVGGLIVFDGAARAVDATLHDAESGALRRLVELVREDGRLAPAVLPIGTGLLAAVATTVDEP
jgi:predicted O-methyltransferase YrrM